MHEIDMRKNFNYELPPGVTSEFVDRFKAYESFLRQAAREDSKTDVKEAKDEKDTNFRPYFRLRIKNLNLEYITR